MRRWAAVVLAVTAVLPLLGTPVAWAAAAPVKTYFYVTLPDGTRLRACSIAEPGALTDGSRHPVILEWTSYVIDGDFGGGFPAGCPPQFGTLADRAAQRGYVYVAANTRGTGASQGTTQDVWSPQDGKDGHDVVEWLARQPWSTGDIGVAGCSNSGAFANGLAATSPPHLRALLTDCAPLDVYRDCIYPGGVGSYSLLFTSSRPIASQVTAQSTIENVQTGNTDFVLRPVNSSEVQASFITDTTDTSTWTSRDLTGRAPFTVPTYYLGSWADYMLRGTTEYAHVRKPEDRILITPGEHASGYSQVTGPYSFTDRALAWFDFWVAGHGKGSDPFAAEPHVLWWELHGTDNPLPTGTSTAVDLSGRFHGSETWPLPDATYTRMWLRTGATGTSQSLHDESLLSTPPTASEPGDTYAYAGPDQAGLVDPQQNGGDSVPSSVSDAGADVATYTSPPVTGAAMHLAGPVSVDLWASTSATETDWVARLVDVAPDGTAVDISQGYLKSAFAARIPSKELRDRTGQVIRPWHDHSVKVAVAPLAPVDYDIELEPTALEVPVGHRLRVVVQSSAGPYSLQTIGPALNTVLHDPAHPSSVLLPLVPASAPVATPAVAPVHRVSRPASHASAPVRAPGRALAATGATGLLPAVGGLCLALAALTRRRAIGRFVSLNGTAFH